MHCEKVKGRVPSVVRREDWERLRTFLEKKLYELGHKMEVWLAMSDKEEEGVWRDHYTRELLHHSPLFTGSTANGGKEENCVTVVPGPLWDDWLCNDKRDRGCVCTKPERPYLRLRGLCPFSDIDTMYLPENSQSDFTLLSYVGNRKTILEFDEVKSLWQAINQDKGTQATARASHDSFILGRHLWMIEEDRGCSHGQGYTTELKLTGCWDGEFTCSDGQCVRMAERCDQVLDCRDESDEINCQVLVLKESYRKSAPPVTLAWDEGKRQVLPAMIHVNLTLLDISDIRETDNEIDIKFTAEFHWIESRATFHNLKKNRWQNTLEQSDIARMWIPKLVYRNNKDNYDTLSELSKARVYITRHGGFSRSGIDVLDEVEVFKGKENPIAMVQSYTKSFKCKYDLLFFPFDTQVGVQVKFSMLCFRFAR